MTIHLKRTRKKWIPRMNLFWFASCVYKEKKNQFARISNCRWKDIFFPIKFYGCTQPPPPLLPLVGKNCPEKWNEMKFCIRFITIIFLFLASQSIITRWTTEKFSEQFSPSSSSSSLKKKFCLKVFDDKIVTFSLYLYGLWP